MMTVRNRILEIDPPHSEKLWLEVSRVSGLERDDIEAMRKDLHLIEAALDQHAAVISSDEKARKPFHTVAQNVKKLTKIVWVNPEQNHEAVLSWLKAGAKPERQWRLGL